MHAFDRQTDKQTDGRTDGRTDRSLIARPRLHSMQRGKNEKKNKLTNRCMQATWLPNASRAYLGGRGIKARKQHYNICFTILTMQYVIPLECWTYFQQMRNSLRWINNRPVNKLAASHHWWYTAIVTPIYVEICHWKQLSFSKTHCKKTTKKLRFS